MGMYETLIISNIKNKIVNHEKIKKRKEERRLQKLEKKNEMIRMFGKTRYRLSYWFGSWFLYAFNNRDYSLVLYQKFYKDLKTTNQYANRLQGKYTKIQIEEVYNKDKIIIGYLLQGKGEKIADCTQQPSNIIPFSRKQNCN
jgi:hypothetical protein